MRERVEQYILQHELISPGDKVLIGLSGGIRSIGKILISKVAFYLRLAQA